MPNPVVKGAGGGGTSGGEAGIGGQGSIVFYDEDGKPILEPDFDKPYRDKLRRVFDFLYNDGPNPAAYEEGEL